jgi:hypothetical protein
MNYFRALWKSLHRSCWLIVGICCLTAHGPFVDLFVPLVLVSVMFGLRPFTP